MKDKLLADILASDSPLELPLDFLKSEVFKTTRISVWCKEYKVFYRYNLTPHKDYNSDITVIFCKHEIG